MKTILIFVATLDGKVTKWGDPYVRKWSSKEDQEYFRKIWKDSRLIVMGSSTYNADRIKPSVNHHFIVMTSEPVKYKELEIPGQLEFSDKSPAQLSASLNEKGYKNMLLVGGPHIATSFLKEQLVDELWLTIEPVIFGTGGNFVINENLDIDLKLLSVEKVNKRGTLIAKYSVINNKTK
jgi:dihydrofolate reductase